MQKFCEYLLFEQIFLYNQGDFMNVIADRLRIMRKIRGFKTAKDFAVKNNIPISTYSMHETGRRGLSIKIAKKYCQLLDLELKWFLTGKT